MSAKVFDELACPECGGRIGGDRSDGLPACKCFEQAAPSNRRKPRTQILDSDASTQDLLSGDLLSSDTATGDGSPTGDSVDGESPSSSAGKKICRVCSKDLTGKPRMKDDGGYICKQCADVEDEKEADLIKCPECLRRLKPDAIIEYRGTLICRRCKQHHEETDKLKVAKVELKHHVVEEKKSVIRLAIILGVLLVVILLGLARSYL